LPGGLFISLLPWQFIHFSFAGIPAETVADRNIIKAKDIPIICNFGDLFCIFPAENNFANALLLFTRVLQYTYIISTPSPVFGFFRGGCLIFHKLLFNTNRDS
jgi:hypothetical protein